MLIIDVLVKVHIIELPIRYLTKPLVVLLLIFFYAANFKAEKQNNFYYMITALCIFLIGDLVLIDTYEGIQYIIGLILFTVAKLFYAFRFSNKKDFKISRLMPFLAICFAYTLWIMNLIYDNLDSFFIPTLSYLFISIVLLLMSFLRKDDVNNTSYYLVFFGVILTVAYDSIAAVSSFYKPLPYNEALTMLFYGISQYLIVVGIVKEVKTK